MELNNLKIRKWGNSFGIVLPKEALNNHNLKEGAEIDILIRTKDKTKVKDIFGLLKGKLKRDSDDLLDEVDRDFEKK
jgi:antitoxin component of MazEF toxin-antitoxin module